jgi:hypothetical protein
MCGLAEVLNQILIHFYSSNQDLSLQRAYQCTVTEGSKLRDWWRDLPDHLKINLATPAVECPPSHIVTLKQVQTSSEKRRRANIFVSYSCLYHTINILLNRARLKLSREPRFATALAEQNPLIQCISSATSIVALFELYNRTFGEGHVVLALAYSVYTAASIFLLEIQAVGHAAPNTLERLSLCVQTLERLRKTSPGMYGNDVREKHS